MMLRELILANYSWPGSIVFLDVLFTLMMNVPYCSPWLVISQNLSQRQPHSVFDLVDIEGAYPMMWSWMAMNLLYTLIYSEFWTLCHEYTDFIYGSLFVTTLRSIVDNHVVKSVRDIFQSSPMKMVQRYIPKLRRFMCLLRFVPRSLLEIHLPLIGQNPVPFFDFDVCCVTPYVVVIFLFIQFHSPIDISYCKLEARFLHIFNQIQKVFC